MKLNQSLEGKRVQILTVDNKVYEGIVEDYIFPEDNEPAGIAAIDLHESSGEWFGFNETEIQSIEVL